MIKERTLVVLHPKQLPQPLIYMKHAIWRAKYNKDLLVATLEKNYQQPLRYKDDLPGLEDDPGFPKRLDVHSPAKKKKIDQNQIWLVKFIAELTI